MTRAAGAGRLRRWASRAAIVLGGGGAGLAVLLAAAAARLPPPDLAPTAERSTLVVDRHGKLLRAFTTPDGRWRLPARAAEVDPRYLALLELYEDRRFRTHRGVDPLALARAGGQLLANGRVVSGGSTLTMQVARLIEPRPGRTLPDKLAQGLQALRLERELSKTQILDLYLTLAPFGGNLEGVRAASFAYLGKEPRRLSLGEAALLVALPQAPEARRPDRDAEAARRARDRVLDRALRAGLVSADEAAEARAERVPRARRPFPALAPHAAERAVAERPAARLHRLTLDAAAQASLEALAADRAASLGPGLATAIVAIETASGEVRALVGGARWLDADRAGALDMTRAVRSPGSALKPFIYALAFDNGLAHPDTLVEDRPSRFGLYAPENFDGGFQGTLPARRALQLSLNVPAVDLLALVTPSRLLGALRGAGAELVLPKEGAPGLAIGLGGVGVTPLDVAGLYAALARGGAALRPTWRTDEAAAGARALVGPAAAFYVADALRAAPPPVAASPGRIAFKTGTSYGHRDAWAAGFDARHTIVAWVGRPDNAAVPGLVGRVAAAPLLFDAFARIGVEPAAPAPPPGAVLVGAAGAAALPPPLRHLRGDVAKTVAALAQAPLRIAHPPDGAQIALDPEDGGVALKAQGGRLPLTWLVDGRPLGDAEPRRATEWRPDGVGFARILVIDASGASDSVTVRLR